jgi:hypothetical protein
MIISLSIIASVILIYLLYGNSSLHLDRNKYNKLPSGELRHLKGSIYVDNADVFWELQDQKKNIFHQPDHEVERIDNPYPNVKENIELDTKNPNLKFLSENSSGGSYEAILQPDGQYLTEGVKQGTYNYGHPVGVWGNLKHALLDVIPHFINDKYRSF